MRQVALKVTLYKDRGVPIRIYNPTDQRCHGWSKEWLRRLASLTRLSTLCCGTGYELVAVKLVIANR
ncbi:hypothetical protein CJU90_1822 [Yarrowia sp. C11]|nr:hypothetical protein CKK34_5850 [Yarrowia sp. E02]KAG5371760.1 hypothetical protein CJU90_1822 [Yarrowia sp. C11]